VPIRPENRDRYPADWAQISLRIKQRADWRCECTGQCGRAHGGLGDGGRCIAHHFGPIPDRVADWANPHRRRNAGRVVLTVAHLDHQPEHCDDENLLAMCQACHLRYDADHHAATARATRAAAAAAAETTEPLWEVS
jgi:hypothetical protein